MAIASVGSFLNANSTTSETTWNAATTSATLEAGNCGVITLAFDNVVTTDTSDPATETDVVSVTIGGIPVKRTGLLTNGNGTAGAGASVWQGVLQDPSANISSGAAVVVVFSSAITSKAIIGWEFTLAAGTQLESWINSYNWFQQDASDPGSLASFGTAPSREYVWFRSMAHETNSATALTPTASWTEIGSAQADTGTAATSMAVRGEFIISTGTASGTSNPSYVTADCVSYITALYEAPARDLSDTTTVSDSVTPVLVSTGISASLSDTAAISDAITKSAVPYQALSDATSVSDSAVPLIANFARSQSDATNVSDSAFPLIANFAITLLDTATATDSISKADVPYKTLSDTSNISDASTTVVDANRALSDQTNASDSSTQAIVSAALTAAPSDVATISDASTQRLANWAAQVSDSIAISDTVLKSAVPYISASDGVIISDAATVLLFLIRSLQDSTAVSDSSTQNLAAASALSLALQDQINLSDTMGKAAIPYAALYDSANISDSKVATVDLVGFLSDAVAISDAKTCTLNLAQTLSDQASVSDASTQSLFNLLRSASLSDQVALSDSSAQILNLTKTLSDICAGSDSANVVVLANIISKALSDGVSIADVTDIILSAMSFAPARWLRSRRDDSMTAEVHAKDFVAGRTTDFGREGNRF